MRRWSSRHRRDCCCCRCPTNTAICDIRYVERGQGGGGGARDERSGNKRGGGGLCCCQSRSCSYRVGSICSKKTVRAHPLRTPFEEGSQKYPPFPLTQNHATEPKDAICEKGQTFSADVRRFTLYKGDWPTHCPPSPLPIESSCLIGKRRPIVT